MAGGMLVQMAGHAGSGKSTVARQLAERTGAAVLDLDTIKSSLLEAGLGWDASSRGSYAAIYALVDDLLSIEGAGVIVDTPSYWAEIGDRLTAAADAQGAAYAFVECVADEVVRARRLEQRPTRRSQALGLSSNPLDAPADLGVLHQREIERPTGRTCVVVRTDGVVDLQGVLASAGLAAFSQPSSG